MKRLLFLVLLALASPAAARPTPAWATLAAREARTGDRIDQAARARQLTAAEAARLRQKLRRVESLRAYYRRSHGMSAWERRDLEGRLKAIDARIARTAPRPSARAEAAPPAPSRLGRTGPRGRPGARR